MIRRKTDIKNHRTRLLRIIVIVSLALCLICVNVFAYFLNGHHIENKITFVPYEKFGATTISHFNEALWQWDDAAGKALMDREPVLRHTSSNYPTSDGKSYIYAVNIGDNDYVAQTTSYYNRDYVVTSADINLNLYYAWANSAQSNAFDVWTVFLHEAGHVVGLGHSNNASAVMYPTVSTNSLRRTFSSDDRAAVHAIYGNGRLSYPILNSNGQSLEYVSGVKNTLVSGLLKEYRYEDLLNCATVIVKATALPGSQVIEVAPASGGDSRNFTNYTFSVSDCLFGDIAQGSHLTVRGEGGRNANQNTVCLESPVISSGQEVILFLQKNDLGGGYTTSDDYYRILGVNQGIFYPSNISGNCFTNISNESISISTILNSIKNKSTVYQGSGSSYSELQKNLQISVSNGVISPADCQDILNSSRSYGYVIN